MWFALADWELMKVLLLHPEDSPLHGPWSSGRWDLVVDLGWAGSYRYDQWSHMLGCPVRGLYGFGEWEKDVLGIKEALRFGSGWVVDGEGIDWWNLIAPTRYQKLFELRLVEKLARELSLTDDVHITRRHWLADVLRKSLNNNIGCFLPEASGPMSTRIRRHRKVVHSLTPAQVIEIALDKWDTDYGFRRLFARRQRDYSSVRSVLMPSGYRNVSRALSAYAEMLPDIRFLLVTTRQGCVSSGLASNVRSVSLASYATVPRNRSTEQEIRSLTGRWLELERKLLESRDLAPAHALGWFKDFRVGLRVGLRIRDAWRSILEQQPLHSVLCGDENNLYTRLPVLLAKTRGICTFYCSHGALDVNVLIRGACSDTYLVKGEMERDYLVGQCEIPEEKVLIGAPTGNPPLADLDSTCERSQIVFFSEPYELYSGRTNHLYGDVLPRLCSIARKHGRRVLLKLHPFESMSSRLRLLDEVLISEDRKLVEVTNEAISDRLFRRTWFSLTVESSVAVECALAGVPCFLCGWFDLGLHGYVQQYEKYGAARVLNSPEKIQQIPELLGSSVITADVQNGLYQSLTRKQLEAILLGTGEPRTTGVEIQGVGSLPAGP
jgi:hypothetical protein